MSGRPPDPLDRFHEVSALPRSRGSVRHLARGSAVSLGTPKGSLGFTMSSSALECPQMCLSVQSQGPNEESRKECHLHMPFKRSISLYAVDSGVGLNTSSPSWGHNRGTRILQSEP